MRFLSVNVHCFLIELDDSEQTMSLYHSLRHQPHPYMTELVPAARTIMVYFQHRMINHARLIQWIQSQHFSLYEKRQSKQIIIDVVYQGWDLVSLATSLGIEVSTLIKRHTEAQWHVGFIGFAPGFAYLTSPTTPFGSVPRLDTPRKKIPAGAVALAGEYSGIYPKESPGGWQIIGQTESTMWDIHRNPPALLLPGDEVIFNDITHQPTQVTVPRQFDGLEKIAVEQASNIDKPCAAMQVIETGLLSVFQDLGRPQLTHWGVGESGAMDRQAAIDANQIVGNPAHAIVIEILNGGFRAVIEQALVIAVTGAESELMIRDQQGVKCSEVTYQAVALEQGDEIYIRPPKVGLRNYLAIRGGIEVEKVFGSASYDSLAHLGPQALQKQQMIYRSNAVTQAVQIHVVAPYRPRVDEVTQIEVVLGPRTDWFTAESRGLFLKQLWQVTADNHRIGIKLTGSIPLKRLNHSELASEATCTGAIQVPTDGQPVIFMRDHPLTGGYPVIANICPQHIDVIAQLAVGSFIQFHAVQPFMDIQYEINA